jgi:TMEM175 potassium channel family protein
MSKGRAEAFSDGVFAVAITVLIFNVTGSVQKHGTGGLLSALLAGWPVYAAYVASFLTIGVMWINHHAMFQRLSGIDRPLLFLNLLLLMAIVFLPFPTSLLGANISVPQDSKAAATFYALNAVVIAILFSALWTYTFTHPQLMSTQVDRRVAMRSWPAYAVGLVGYLVCVPLGQLSPVAVVIVCSALAIYYMFERLPSGSTQRQT